MKRVATLALALVAAVTAHAGPEGGVFVTGNLLHTNFRGSDQAKLYAVGYVVGVADAANGLWQHNTCFNIPSGRVTQQQVADIVDKYIEANPEYRHFNGEVLVSVALAKSFPCRKK